MHVVRQTYLARPIRTPTNTLYPLQRADRQFIRWTST